jgi:hypothetical protein
VPTSQPGRVILGDGHELSVEKLDKLLVEESLRKKKKAVQRNRRGECGQPQENMRLNSNNKQPKNNCNNKEA